MVAFQLTSFRGEGLELANLGELFDRLNLWLVAARTGSINIDRAPFAFALMCLTWLSGYLAAWLFFRHRNFWGVFVVGGAGLLCNLTYLPTEGSIYLGFYLLTALLLVARVQAVRRLQDWKRRGMQADSHLGILSLSDSVIVTFFVLLVAFVLLPTGRFWEPTHNVYEYMRSPHPALRGGLQPPLCRPAGSQASALPHLGRRHGLPGHHQSHHHAGVAGGLAGGHVLEGPQLWHLHPQGLDFRGHRVSTHRLDTHPLGAATLRQAL